MNGIKESCAVASVLTSGAIPEYVHDGEVDRLVRKRDTVVGRRGNGAEEVGVVEQDQRTAGVPGGRLI